MINMRHHFTGLAMLTLLALAPAVPGHAEDAAAPPAAAPDQAAPATPQAQTPASVPRPSIVPKTAEPAPAPAPAADEAPPRHHRRYAHRHYRRYAYWEPFPIYWPHFFRHRLYWSRISWFAF
jgi:hypothetical protein